MIVGRWRCNGYEYKWTRTGIAVNQEDRISEVGEVVISDEGDISIDTSSRRCASITRSA